MWLEMAGTDKTSKMERLDLFSRSAPPGMFDLF